MIDLSIQYKRKYLKGLNKLKNNLSLIVLVPTIVGGIIQSLQLSLISPSLLRFFSISQLVSDGVFLISLGTFTIVLPYLISNWIYPCIKKINPISLQRIILITLVILSALPYFYILHYHSEQSIKDKIELRFFSIIGLTFTIFFDIFLMINLNQSLKMFNKLVTMIINFLTISIIIIGVTSAIKFFLILSIKTPIDNFQILEKKYSAKGKIEILYFNDKYIFLKIKGNKDSKIHIEKIESIFDEMPATNSR